jgi:negative regulator of flagellin synthesis FlgM
MKIGQTPELPGALGPAAQAKQQAKPAAAAADEAAKAAPAKAATAGVPVTMSNSLKALDISSRASGDFDAGRVKAVKDAIDKGEFSVDAEAIADKLLANAQEIFSRSRRG